MNGNAQEQSQPFQTVQSAFHANGKTNPFTWFIFPSAESAHATETPNNVKENLLVDERTVPVQFLPHQIMKSAVGSKNQFPLF